VERRWGTKIPAIAKPSQTQVRCVLVLGRMNAVVAFAESEAGMITFIERE